MLAELSSRSIRTELAAGLGAGLHRFAAAYSAYATDALARLGVADLPADSVLQSEWEDCWGRERSKFKLYFLMREALAPLIENLLVLDRALFIHEQLNNTTTTPTVSSPDGEGGAGAKGGTADAVVRMFPIFEPGLSPRNLCIYATGRSSVAPE